jgi:hypothetical protein
LEILPGQDLNYLLDNNGITVSENEIIISALATVNIHWSKSSICGNLERPV